VRLLHETEEFAARVDYDLRKPVMVAKVNEKNATVVSEAEHPSGKFYCLACVGCAQFVARMGAVRVHNLFLLTIEVRIIPNILHSIGMIFDIMQP
jgi:hypothetical protein